MVNSVQFGSIYKVKIQNVPEHLERLKESGSTLKPRKASDFAYTAQKYIRENTTLDLQDIDRVSHRSVTNGANTGAFEKADTFWIVTDDADGKDYTEFKEKRKEITSKVKRGKLKLTTNLALSWLLTAGGVIREGVTSSIARAKMVPVNYELKNDDRVKELVFDASLIDENSRTPYSSLNYQVSLVEGEL